MTIDLQRKHRLAIASVAAFVVLLLVRCVSAPPARGMVVCGAPFDLGTRVVTWREPGGYDAYQTRKFFAPDDTPGKLRYSPLRGGLPEAM
ncbi:MAG TPA: hypothetical protein VFT55_15030, partial [Planctomycetota bacterium]|nr:hypothetical protein [Planctomycetota bacterium]